MSLACNFKCTQLMFVCVCGEGGGGGGVGACMELNLIIFAHAGM